MRHTLFFSLLISITFASGTFAQGGKATRQSADSKRKAASRAGTSVVSDEEIDAALTFARVHHAELAELLEQLRDNSPTEFKRGIREVHRVVRRLERLQEKQPPRYINELQRWKISSRLQLVAARWAMSQDPELEEMMRDLIRQRAEIRVLALKEERKRITKRLSKLDSQISDASEGRDDYVAKAMSRIKKQVVFNEKVRQAHHNKTLVEQPRQNQKAKNPGSVPQVEN